MDMYWDDRLARKRQPRPPRDREPRLRCNSPVSNGTSCQVLERLRTTGDLRSYVRLLPALFTSLSGRSSLISTYFASAERCSSNSRAGVCMQDMHSSFPIQRTSRSTPNRSMPASSGEDVTNLDGKPFDRWWEIRSYPGSTCMRLPTSIHHLQLRFPRAIKNGIACVLAHGRRTEAPTLKRCVRLASTLHPGFTKGSGCRSLRRWQWERRLSPPTTRQ